MTSRIHTNAVHTLLTATTRWTLRGNLFDAEVVGTNATPYTIVWPDPGLSTYDTLDALPNEFRIGFQCTHVGGDRNEAQWEADEVAAVLVGAVPVVTGRACGPIEQTGNGGSVTQDVDSRTTTDRRAWVLAVLYGFTSHTA